MIQCKIEFFEIVHDTVNHRTTFEYLHHDVIPVPEIDTDYISPTSTSITIGKTDKLSRLNLVWIKDPYQFLGYIDEVSYDEHVTEITVKPFESIFSSQILFNTNYQSDERYSLEYTIAHYIQAYFKDTTEYADELQNLPIDDIRTTSSTVSWSMNLKSDDENMHHTIIDFYGVLIARALTKYGIVIKATPDFANKKIDISIGKVADAPIVIDADLKNVKIRTFTIDSASSNVNKVEIWNTENYTELVYYYLHPDKTFDDGTQGKPRITPVVFEVTTATPSEATEEQPAIDFEMAAYYVALDTFSGVEWENLIELDCALDDPLIHAENLRIGQTCLINHEGSQYTSILTGKLLSTGVVLVFGTIRIDLTKKLKKGG